MFAQCTKKNGGPKAAVLIVGLVPVYWNNFSTFWSACEASDRAVVDSC